MPISVTGHSFALIGVGGGLGIVLFDAIEAGQAIVVLLKDGRVEELLAVGIGAGSGMDQPVLGSCGRCKMYALGLSRMASRVSKARLLRLWRSSRRARTNSARARWSGGAGLPGLHTAVDGDAMDAVGFGGIGEGRAVGQGVDDALLDAHLHENKASCPRAD